MPIQSELFPPDASDPLPPLPTAQTGQKRDGNVPVPVPVWLQRLSLVVMVTFCFYVGLLLFCLPWTRFWYQNQYLLAYPWLSSILLHGATRGVISGIGLLDFWIGLSEAIHYRDYRP